MSNQADRLASFGLTGPTQPDNIQQNHAPGTSRTDIRKVVIAR